MHEQKLLPAHHYLFYLIVKCDINLAECLPHLENGEWAKKTVWVRPKSCVLIVVTAAFGMSDRLVNSDGKLMPACQMPTNLLSCVTLLPRFLELCLWLSFSLAGLGSLQSFTPPNQRSVWHHHHAPASGFFCDGCSVWGDCCSFSVVFYKVYGWHRIGHVTRVRGL